MVCCRELAVLVVLRTFSATYLHHHKMNVSYVAKRLTVPLLRYGYDRTDEFFLFYRFYM